MADVQHDLPEARPHGDAGFEHTDVNIKPIVGFLVVLSGCLVAIMIALWVWHEALERGERARKRPSSPLAVMQVIPPEPRIEGLQPGLADYTVSHSVNKPDLPTSALAQRARATDELKKGWKDAQGRWHPPIDEAMRRVVDAARPKPEDKK